MKKLRKTNRSISILALFTSTGTLICCALPIALVSLGMGAAVISLTSSFPFLVTLSEHKIWIFSLSGLLLLAGWLISKREQSCPADPELAVLCQRTQKWNRRILLVSTIIWSIGFFAAYLALPIRQLLEI